MKGIGWAVLVALLVFLVGVLVFGCGDNDPAQQPDQCAPAQIAAGVCRPKLPGPDAGQDGAP